MRWKFRNVVGETAAIGSAGQYTLVVDRPADGGGLGLGFNGGQLLYLAIGGCVSNDLFREASARGINLTTVRVLVRGNFTGEPAVSEDVSYEVELGGGRAARAVARAGFACGRNCRDSELSASRHTGETQQRTDRSLNDRTTHRHAAGRLLELLRLVPSSGLAWPQ